jgi:hypothetical protein
MSAKRYKRTSEPIKPLTGERDTSVIFAAQCQAAHCWAACLKQRWNPFLRKLILDELEALILRDGDWTRRRSLWSFRRGYPIAERQG